MLNAYEVLGVSANAGEATIRAAFRKAAKRCHPDLHGGDLNAGRRLRQLIAARDALIGRKRRSPFLHNERLWLPAPKRRKVFAIAGAAMLAGMGMAMALLFLFSNPGLPQPAATAFERTAALGVPAKAAPEREQAAIPDAESADIKAIRDAQETLHPRTGRKPAPASSPPGPRAASQRSFLRPRLNDFRRAVSRASSKMSKTWRRLASKLPGT